MFYTIGLLLVFAVILLIFDHKSMYSWLFVLMAVGGILAFFFIILHISIFASYGHYAKDSMYYWVDGRIYAWITERVAVPLVTNIRMINLGIFVYLMAVTGFNYAFGKELPKQKSLISKKVINMLTVLVLLAALILPDPVISTKLYLVYHKSENQELLRGVYSLIEIVYKFSIFLLLLRPIRMLLRAVIKMEIPFLKRKLLVFTIGLIMMNSVFYLFFYFSAIGMSVDKVIRSGFWIFESVTGHIPKVYATGSSVIFIMICFEISILLSFRMDISTLFVEKKVQHNLMIMNEVLGETLHSQKNLLFAMQILGNKLEKRMPEEESIPELSRLKNLIDHSLDRTTEMLDAIREAKYKYLDNDVLDIIDQAVTEIRLPDGIVLEWNRSLYEGKDTYGFYDKYHLEKALVNILNNAVEAIELSGKENGIVRIRVDYMLRWLVLMVWDNGVGISRKQKRQIFTPHYSGKTGKMNWGLGLSYVFKVMKAHMGQIRIDSKYGRYTSVLLLLPKGRKRKAVQGSKKEEAYGYSFDGRR